MGALKDFHGRGVSRYQRAWNRALQAAWAVDEADLPPAANRGDGPPPPRSWKQRDPEAAARLDRARSGLGELAEKLGLPVENLLTPDLVRRLMWEPPSTDRDGSAEGVADFLAAGGARPWQIELTTGLLADALVKRPAAEAAPQPGGADG